MKKCLWILVLLMICGCSSSKKAPDSVEIVESAQVETSAPSVELPFILSMTGAVNGDETVVTLNIEYKQVLPVEPVLRITAHGNTVVTNMMLEQRLEMPHNPGVVTKEIRLTGTEPAIDVSLSQNSEGFGVEVHDSWPPAKGKKVVEPRRDVTPLPAAIEVGGTQITHGVDVHP